MGGVDVCESRVVPRFLGVPFPRCVTSVQVGVGYGRRAQQGESSRRRRTLRTLSRDRIARGASAGALAASASRNTRRTVWTSVDARGLTPMATCSLQCVEPRLVSDVVLHVDCVG